MNVWFGFCEQLATSSRGQFVANWTNKSKLQDPFITPNKISVGDEQNGPIFIGRSYMQKVAKKWKWSRWWWVWTTNLKIRCKLGSIGWIKKGAIVEEEGELRTPS